MDIYSAPPMEKRMFHYLAGIEEQDEDFFSESHDSSEPRKGIEGEKEALEQRKKRKKELERISRIAQENLRRERKKEAIPKGKNTTREKMRRVWRGH